MGYKTILTVVTQTGQIAQLESAMALARREDAHLEVFALGVDRTQTGYYYAGASAYVFQEAVDRAMATAEAIEAEMREQLSHEDIRWSLDSAIAQIGGLSSLVAMRARCGVISTRSSLRVPAFSMPCSAASKISSPFMPFPPSRGLPCRNFRSASRQSPVQSPCSGSGG